ncbi:DUF1772 domain-containing protein [Nocardia carnea]|uniref:DUF1772 domain-containing protein n=1 Tax=Nocardia carnea TaxID=37328 RepID=A0ABW7TKK0_9NOCA|nr:DUF1772 domain-containing protein [Nocardia carnea]
MRKIAYSMGGPALFAGLAVLAFGGIGVETLIVYPNVFHNVPDSLAEASEFFDVVGPGDVLPPLGALTALAALVAVGTAWQVTAARGWLGAGLLTLLGGEYLFSVLYFWPRNEIMFDEGAAVHSVEFLRQTATEFETAHWFRLAISGITAALAVIGFLRAYREHVLLRRDVTA